MALPVRHIDAPRPRPPAAPKRDGTSVTSTRPDLRVVPRRRAAMNAALLLLVVIVTAGTPWETNGACS